MALDLVQPASASEIAKKEFIKKQNLIDSSVAASLAAAAQQALSAALSLKASQEATKKSSSANKKKPEPPAIQKTPTTAKTTEKQASKKQQENNLSDDDSIVNSSLEIKQLCADHQNNINQILNKNGVFVANPYILAQQQAALKGGAVVLNAQQTQVQVQAHNEITQAVAQDKSVFVEPELVGVRDVFKEMQAQERQNVAKAIALNSDFNTATAEPIFNQYAQAARQFEHNIHQFTTQYVRAKQTTEYPAHLVSNVLAAYFEIQFLGRRQRLEDIYTKNICTPAFLAHLGLARYRSTADNREREEMDNPMGYSVPRISSMPPMTPFRF